MVLTYLMNEFHQDISPSDYTVYEGEVFTAVKLRDGSIGICANIGSENAETAKECRNNIIKQALINAKVNRPELSYDNASFTEIIPLKEKKNIIMLGFIEPVYIQMNKIGIGCKVFDFRKKSPILSPLSEYDESLKAGDTFIITATTLNNGSFDELIQKSKNGAEIYIVGPSAPMTRHLFNYTEKLKAVFGSIVISEKAIDAVLKGAGTRSLSPFLRKGSVIR